MIPRTLQRKAEKVLEVTGHAGDYRLLNEVSHALAQARAEALAEASRACAGPDEGYLHGCDCRMRVNEVKVK